MKWNKKFRIIILQNDCQQMGHIFFFCQVLFKTSGPLGWIKKTWDLALGCQGIIKFALVDFKEISFKTILYVSCRILKQPFRPKVFDWVYLESFEIVDEYVWEPKLIDQLEVDRNHGALLSFLLLLFSLLYFGFLAEAGARVEVIEEEPGYL